MNFLNFINHPLVGNPYGIALDLCIVLAIVCWVLSILTREYSWTDRLWSIVPAVYCLIVAVDLEFQSARVNIMTVLATLWGIRLTFNYALKGGYWIGGEDYRWIYLRKKAEQPGISAAERDCYRARSDGHCVVIHRTHSSGLGIFRVTHGMGISLPSWVFWVCWFSKVSPMRRCGDFSRTRNVRLKRGSKSNGRLWTAACFDSAVTPTISVKWECG